MTATPSSPMTKPALEPAELLGFAMAAKTLLPSGLMVKSKASVDASCARAVHTTARRANNKTSVLRMARYGTAQKGKTKELHREHGEHRGGGEEVRSQRRRFLYTAMPTAASIPILSSVSISRRVLIPPAAMMG